MDAQRILVIDTCGSGGSVALAEGERVVASDAIAERAASARLLEAVGEVLAEAGWVLGDVEAVGVVSGPGSFTGVRVGLAAAKGLCEGMGVPMAAVSRLEVLADVGRLRDGFAALEAGRGEVFVRGSDGREELMLLAEFVEASRGAEVVVAEESLLGKLGEGSARLVVVDAASALGAVRRCLLVGGSDVALVDANYGRGEAQIYAKKASA